MNFAKLSVATRLGLGFGALVLMMLAVTAVALVNMAAIEGRLDEIVNDNGRKTELINDMSESVHITSRVIRTIVLLTDDAEMKTENAKIVAARKRYDEASEALEKMPASEQGRALRARVREAAASARPLNDSVLELAFAHKDAEALKALRTQASPATQRWQGVLDENREMQEKNNKQDFAAAQGAYSRAFSGMLVLGGAALVIALISALLIARSLVRQLGGEPAYAAEVAGRIAAGDLHTEVVTRTGDSSSLLAGMKAMQLNLHRLVGEVRVSTESISTGSKQIASGNADLSSRTEAQASSLEETASSMEELTSTVRQNAENARQANQLAAGASEVAVKGGSVVGQVVETMSSINESSKKVVEIISVIDGIAFQTNILALNAAVEAARAGEQGRGFAVVATEVRTLAQRSAAAAKEIKALIGDSVHKVEDGSRLVDEAGRTMAEIVAAVKRVTDIMAEISAASQEQSSGIEQVNQAVTQMDRATQQNAALVEEAAAAAESMQEQAQALVASVAVFKLAEAGAAGAAMSSTPAASKSAMSSTPSTVRALPAKAMHGGDQPGQSAQPARVKSAPAGEGRPRKRAVGAGEAAWEEF